MLLHAMGCARAVREWKAKKEYKMQVTVSPQTYWGMGATRFADLVREKTGGQINVKPYFGSQLLKGAQLNAAQMVAVGAVDLAFESTINTAPVIPEMNIFSLPFFIETYERLDLLEEGETGKIIFEAMQKKRIQPLAWGENGFRQLTNSKRAVRRPEDLKGLRVRVVGSPVFIDIFRQLRADPINMNWGDAVTAFQQGTVDGQENPAGILVPVQIHQYHQYATFWNYLVDPLIMYWCKSQWDAFPGEIQKAIEEAAIEATRYQKAMCRAGLDGGASSQLLKETYDTVLDVTDPVAFLEEHGMQVHKLSEDERAAFKTATRPVFEKWIPKVGQHVYDAALRDLNE